MLVSSSNLEGVIQSGGMKPNAVYSIEIDSLLRYSI